jgi:signal transduction histidine kinase/CheY-like chemotaxis protein
LIFLPPASLPLAQADVTDSLRRDGEVARLRRQLEDQARQHADEMAALQAQVQTAVRAKQEFLANVGHEVRTPMNAIIGLAHLAGRGATAEQAAQLGKLTEAARQLLGVLNDVLEFSRLAGGVVALSLREANLRASVRQVCQAMAARAADKGLELCEQVDPAVPETLLLDDLRLRQVLVQLIGNAVKFTTKGRVSLNVHCRAKDAHGARVRFEVADTGNGLDPAALSALTQPFAQGDGTATRFHGGLGLGLATCQQLLRLMGSELAVESVLGQGSRFHFELQLRVAQCAGSQASAASVSPAAATPVPLHHGQNVLVAEDNPLNFDVVKQLLQAVGLGTIHAVNGREAVEMLQARPDIALVLMDLHMPECDGLAAARAIRSLGAYGAMPIIGWSAEDMAREGGVGLAACYAAGMNAVLAKPVAPDDLYRELRRWLPTMPSLWPNSAPPQLGAVASDGAFEKESPWRRVAGLRADLGLRSVRGDQRVFARLLERFHQVHAGDVAKLRQHLALGEWRSVYELAHALKGTAGSIGALPLAAAAADLPAKGDTPHGPAAAMRLADELERLLEGLGAALAQWQREPSTPSSTVNLSAAQVRLQLVQAVRQRDMLAQRFVREHAQAVMAAMGPQCDALIKALDAFDYNAALAILGDGSPVRGAERL